MWKEYVTRRLGIPWWAVLVLVSLAVPRILVHDLGATPGAAVEAVLTLVPAVVWIVVAVWARVPSPVLTLVTVGSLYGVVLAIVHNLLWDAIFDFSSPDLGGALAGELAPGTEEVLLRFAMTVSSVFTGMIAGLIAGLVATLICARRPPKR